MPGLDYIVEQDNLTGVIKFFNREKGYGFISIEDADDVFLHVSHVDGFDPNKGDKVSFSLATDLKRKRHYAVEVTLCQS